MNGPVEMSGPLLSLVAYIGSYNPANRDRAELQDVMGLMLAIADEDDSVAQLNTTMSGYDSFPLDQNGYEELRRELASLHASFGDTYPTEILYEANGTGIKTHMQAQELPVGWKFEIDGVSGGAGVPKQWRRIENPFGPDVVDGMIAGKVTHAYDGTSGKTEKIKADTIVRPCMGGPDVADNFIRGSFNTPEEIDARKVKWDESREAGDALGERTNTYIKQRYAEAGLEIKNPACFYSAYQTVEDVPQDNLDEVAVEGPCIFIGHADDYWGGDEDEKSEPFQSEVLESPTWLELCYHFERCMQATKDYHHSFLEGAHKADKEIDGVPVYEFSTGS